MMHPRWLFSHMLLASLASNSSWFPDSKYILNNILTHPSTMRSFLSLNKCLLHVIETINIGINPASRPISKTPDCSQGNRVQACFDCILKINKAIIAILPCIALHGFVWCVVALLVVWVDGRCVDCGGCVGSVDCSGCVGSVDCGGCVEWVVDVRIAVDG